MKCSRVGFRDSGQKSPHDKVIFEQRLEEGKEQTMEVYIREGVLQAKGASKTKTLDQDMLVIFQDHKEGSEGWRQQVSSEGLDKERIDSGTVIKGPLGSLVSRLAFTLNETRC